MVEKGHNLRYIVRYDEIKAKGNGPDRSSYCQYT